MIYTPSGREVSSIRFRHDGALRDCTAVYIGVRDDATGLVRPRLVWVKPSGFLFSADGHALYGGDNTILKASDQ